MAVNYTISFTFAPNTTISSSQANTNFSDNANTWNGIEAKTKTLAALKMDADPTSAMEVATKQYVDHYSTWRRPVLSYTSVTTVSVESGLDGTSGDIPMLFPDGSVRTETSTTRTRFDITRNAVLTTSGAQSGLRTTLSEATNTWYALYAVKVTDSSTQWCTVGDTVLPVQGSYATLNSNFGTSGWVYLGLIRNGDNNSATGDIIKFKMAGNRTVFTNESGSGNSYGLLLATASATASNLTYTYASGTGTAQIPSIVGLVTYGCHVPTTTQAGSSTKTINSQVGGNTVLTSMFYFNSKATFAVFETDPIVGVVLQTSGGTDDLNIWLRGIVDSVLGVGSNPIL